MTFAPAFQCLAAFDAQRFEAAEMTSLIKEAARLRTMVEAAWVSVIRRASELSAATTLGFRTTTDLIAATTGERRGSIHPDVDLGTALAEAPVIREPFAAGELSRSKTVELLRATSATEQQQEELVGKAKGSSIGKVRQMIDEFLADNDNDNDREPPMAPNTVTIRHGRNGGTLTATLEPVRLNLLEIAIDTAIAKLALPKELPYAERRAEALLAIAKFFVEHINNTTHVRGSRPHVSVVVDIETVERRANRPARLENGQYITGERARQLCCDAGITRIVSGPRSQPLDVGTATRSFPAAMARAIIARDKHCVHPGCEAPPWACEIHHKHHVANGGMTSIENGELRCWYHHDLQHQHDRERFRRVDPSNDRPASPDLPFSDDDQLDRVAA